MEYIYIVIVHIMLLKQSATRCSSKWRPPVASEGVFKLKANKYIILAGFYVYGYI